MELGEFIIDMLKSPLSSERRRAKETLLSTLRELQEKGEVDLAESLIESYLGREAQLISQIPQVSKGFLEWWEEADAL